MKPSLRGSLRSLGGLFSRSHDPGTGKAEEEELEAIAAKEKRVFRYAALVAATQNFSPDQKLGQGGFGPVYKGRLEDGREVAVKRLGIGSKQGAKEFANEATVLLRVQHKNVVNLLGYCAHGGDMLLVYEYVLNESLDKLLFGTITREGRSKRSDLDWQRRFGIMVGVARGLVYLHEDAHTPIIHRDIKAGNILLDEHWTPKIADFGMARLFPEDQTHVKTRVAGTNGYMAPEYLMYGSLSTKADVFSFGIVVLELISGQKNSHFIAPPGYDILSLLEWAWNLYKKEESLELLDPALKLSANPEQVALCVQVALLCTQADPKLRPDMSRVLRILSRRPTTLEEPTQPAILGSWHQRRPVKCSRDSSSGMASGSTSAVSTIGATSSSVTGTLTDNEPRHLRSPENLPTSSMASISHDEAARLQKLQND